MDRTSFEEALRAEGYEALTREVAPGRALDEHEHAWDVRGLVLSGRFTIAAAGETHSYAAGEVFELAAGVLHTEEAGPDGAHLLLGRRHLSR